jgi:uncharacterized membrane protein
MAGKIVLFLRTDSYFSKYSTKPKMSSELFSIQDQEQITAAIQSAENQTSGEIRVHLERSCIGNVLDRASQVFENLRMHKTKLRNGVLIYLAYEDRKFAILGDAGINSAVPENFWDEIKIRMQSRFRSGHFVDGLCEGVELAGKQLKSSFPRGHDDVNELPDKISFG